MRHSSVNWGFKTFSTQTLKQLPNMESNLKLNLSGIGVNHRQNMAFMLQTPVAGQNGWAVALRELIINSVDAGATDIRIIQLPDGRLLIADNGKGMNDKAINSALSFGFSSKSRNDLTTAGTNGTGQNISLGLGEITNTKIEVITTTDGVNFTQFEKDYEYLCLLAEQKIDPETRKKKVIKPADWTRYFARTQGTNVLLTNCKRIPALSVVIREFSAFLVPAVAEMIEIWDGTRRKLVPDIHDGKSFVAEESLGKFGSVNFELFIGAVKRSKIQICGPTNMVMTLPILLERYANKSADLGVLSSCSGWIYLSDMNRWRLHDGSFSQEFFDGGAAVLFMEALLRVAAKIKLHLQQMQQEKMSEEFSAMLMEFVSANNLEFTNPTAGKGGGVLKLGGGTSKELEVQIVPNVFYLEPNQTSTLVFENQGTLKLDPTRWQIDDASSPGKVRGKRLGNVLELQSTSSMGKGTLILTHPDLDARRSYEIKVVVGPKPEVFIEGPGKIQSGTEIVYKLRHFENDTKISWSIKERDSDVTVRSSGKRVGVLLSKVVQRRKTLTLVVHDTSFGRKLAERDIEVFPPVQTGEMRIMIHNQQFQLQPTPMLFNGPLAHQGSEYGPIPVIALNFNAQSLVLMPNKKQQLLNSVATAGISWLVQNGKLNATDMALVLEEFLGRMNRRMKMS